MLPNPRPRILCVDDDEDSRVMLITLFRLALIEAKAVGSAAHALSLIQSEHFDLYTLDAWLPGTDGFELCRRVRALDPPAPILFFSGAAYAADKQKGIDAGADAYVTKPDIDELVTRVKQFMSGDVQQPVANTIVRWEILPVLPAADTITPAQVLIPPPSLAKLPIPSRLMSLPAERGQNSGRVGMAPMRDTAHRSV